jgi:hypothetical protein
MNEKVKKLYKKIQDTATKKGLEEKFGLFRTHIIEQSDETSLMFVGRDTYCHPEGLIERTEYAVLRDSDGSNWTYDYCKGRKSQFWRVIGKIQSAYTGKPFDRRVFDNMYWSNLYKIVYKDQMTIEKDMKDQQTELCSDLLYEEIFDIKPKAVLFLTGDNIGKFLAKWEREGKITKPAVCKNSGVKSSRSGNQYSFTFNFVNNKQTVPALALHHPQGKKEHPFVDIASKFIDSVKSDEFVPENFALNYKFN